MLQIGAALFYYKLGQTLLQIGAAITNEGNYYKLGHNRYQAISNLHVSNK